MLTDFNTRTIFSARRIKADAGYSRGIVALQRLIALILLMRADSKITLSIVQRIQTDMIDLVSFGASNQISVHLSPRSVDEIRPWIGSTLQADIPLNRADFVEAFFVKHKGRTVRKLTVADSVFKMVLNITRHSPIPAFQPLLLQTTSADHRASDKHLPSDCCDNEHSASPLRLRILARFPHQNRSG